MSFKRKIVDRKNENASATVPIPLHSSVCNGRLVALVADQHHVAGLDETGADSRLQPKVEQHASSTNNEANAEKLKNKSTT